MSMNSFKTFQIFIGETVTKVELGNRINSKRNFKSCVFFVFFTLNTKRFATNLLEVRTTTQ